MLNQIGKGIQESPVDAEQIGSIVDSIESGQISGKIGKEILFEMFKGTKKLAQDIAKEKGWTQVSDDGSLREICSKVLDANPAEVQRYKNGTKKLLKFFMGEVMRESKGKANPDKITAMLEKALEE